MLRVSNPLVLRVSDKGLNFIAGFEGFVSHPYNDAAGHATIGYGHLIHYGPVTARDRLRYPAGISRAAALKLLRHDAARAEAGVREYVKRPLKQHEFDALVSFAFNCGVGALQHSTLLRHVNGRYGALSITDDFERWSHAGGVVLAGLLRRRKAEAALFCHGHYH